MKSIFHWIFVFTVVLFGIVTTATNPSEDVLRELHSKFAKYNKDLRPDIGGDPVTVGVSMYVLAVQDISDKNMEFTLDMYLRQFWNDSRLAFEVNEAINKIVFGAEKIEEIWKPDTFFVNKRLSVYKGTDTDSDSFMRIEQNGMILVSKRITVKGACPMDFSRYPMDSQMCTLELESFSHSMNDIRYEWKDGKRSVQLSPDVSLPNFNVLGHRQRLVEASLSSGNYSRLLIDFQFVRASGHSIMYHFIPAGFLVAFSWLSFFVDHQKTMARLALGMAPLFSIMFLEMRAVQDVSPISYWKAIDIYMYFCCFIVVASILVTVLMSFTEKMKYRKANNDEACKGHVEAANQSWIRVDFGCFVIFTLVFLVFNLVFGGIYGGENEKVDDLINL